MFRRIFITSVTTVALIASGLGLSVPAMAADKAGEVVTGIGQQAPYYVLESVSGSEYVIRLVGARAELRGMNLSAVDLKTSQVLDTFPEGSVVFQGASFRYQYDISDPQNVVVRLVQTSKNRFNWLGCAGGAALGGIPGQGTNMFVGALKLGSLGLRLLGPVGFAAGAAVGCVVGGLNS